MIMRITLYARISTRDKDKNPETQLLCLRQFVSQHSDWQVTHTYIDQASANDLLHRTRWKHLQDAAVKRQFDAVPVFKLGGAFRSVKHIYDTLDVWDALPVGFLSAQEGFDTTTALARLLLNWLASLAEFELKIIRNAINPKKQERMDHVLPFVRSRTLSGRKVAHQTEVVLSTLQRHVEEAKPYTNRFDEASAECRPFVLAPHLYRKRKSLGSRDDPQCGAAEIAPD